VWELKKRLKSFLLSKMCCCWTHTQKSFFSDLCWILQIPESLFRLFSFFLFFFTILFWHLVFVCMKQHQRSFWGKKSNKVFDANVQKKVESVFTMFPTFTLYEKADKTFFFLLKVLVFLDNPWILYRELFSVENIEVNKKY